MNPKALTATLLLTAAPLTALAAPGAPQSTPAQAGTSLQSHIVNFQHPETGLYTGGQPDRKAWPALQARNVTTVINLRSDGEMKGRDEADAVQAAGMRYVHLPIAGADDVNRDNARRLHKAMTNADGAVLVHCASGNRVGALLAIDASQADNEPAAAAIARGKAAGLTGLEPRVREVLDAPAQAASVD